MHESEIKNIVNGELQEWWTKLSVSGCPTVAGCGKTMEIDVKIGDLLSDIYNLKEFRKAQTEKTEHIESQRRELIKFARDAAENTAIVAKYFHENKKEMRRFMTGLFVAVFVLLLGTFGKLWQDGVNQKETAGLFNNTIIQLNTLSDKIEKLEAEQ